MPREADTHIRVSSETWTRLTARKKPGDSFDDVIKEALDELEEFEDSAESGEPDEPPDTPTVPA